ncbi:MAG: MmgE/PrpD family protein [Pseudomonadota bacterium]|nr:MmgE/PrpD family protein [Pseudomonadota bacterium]
MTAATSARVRTTAPFADVAAFARGLSYADLPSDVVAQAQRCLLDLIGVATAGSRTPAAAIVNAYASTQLAGRDRSARILFDGRRAGLAGAAFAGATTIDAFDAHDGHVLTKGHAGVALLPALLAYLDSGVASQSRSNGREFLTCIVIGYEVATRAGMALHATVSDYHCSGAWNALACAALGGRWLEFDDERMRHALGIAEYLGPRGQILRVCATPTMLKDGSGWGAQVGVSAALLASDGFTGAPALTVERDDASEFWGDLGSRWRIREQYFKAYPVCRWAQPATEAALTLKRLHDFDEADVVAVSIESFREAIDLGSQCAAPLTTDEAQYSLPYAVAAALVYGRIGAADVEAAALRDPRIKRLLEMMTLTNDAEFSRRFPAERWARVRITLRDGRALVSEPARARGNPENPLADDELRAKYRELAEPVLGAQRAAHIEALVNSLAIDNAALSALAEELLSSPANSVAPAQQRS